MTDEAPDPGFAYSVAQRAAFVPDLCPVCGTQMDVLGWVPAGSAADPSPRFYVRQACPWRDDHLEAGT